VTDCIQGSHSWETTVSSASHEISRILWIAKSFTVSQQPVTYSYSESAYAPYRIYCQSILILFFDLSLSFSSGLFPSGFLLNRCTSAISHTSLAFLLYLYSWLDKLNDSWFGERIKKLLVIKSLSARHTLFIVFDIFIFLLKLLHYFHNILKLREKLDYGRRVLVSS
jgi:hypothetical protein